MTPALILLVLVTLQRLGELVIARRNTAALLAKGGIEHAAGHYPAIVLLHAAWLATLWVLGWNQPLVWPWVIVFAVLQCLRVWVLMTLGERWTTRIITLPDAPPVTGGPFRFLRHPNYCVVIGEIAALPLAFGLPWVAVLFSLLNAAVLTIRIRAENGAWQRG